MEITPADIPDVLVVDTDRFGDERGFFWETWSAERYAAAGLPTAFVQDNLSRSNKGVLRGLHLQHPFGQGKLVSVLAGAVFDVAVDARIDSPTFGRFVGVTLSADNHRQLYIPPGFAHGFCVTSDVALFAYKCTERYHPQAELGVAFDDPDLAIPWPVPSPTQAPTVSQKDRAYPRLANIPRSALPTCADSQAPAP